LQLRREQQSRWPSTDNEYGYALRTIRGIDHYVLPLAQEDRTRAPTRGVRLPSSGGAEPNTLWLDGCLTLDEKGFLKTGSDLLVEDLGAANWPFTRRPYMLETSMPSDFAVGDVRDGSVKCVASSVSAGSIAISFMHQNLAQ
jgi:thioredoxin reductase